MSNIQEKELFRETAGDFGEMLLPDLIEWLEGIAEEQSCKPEEISFRVTQYGDSYDGYGEADIVVYRMETQLEADEREAVWKAEARARQARMEAEELAQLQRLKIKYEKEPK